MPKLEFSDAARFISSLKSRPTFAYRGSKAYVELHQMIDELCELYVCVSDDQRERIRNLAAEPPSTIGNQLLSHIGWAGEQALSSKDGEWVRRGLAAASIEDNRLDYRDMFRALGGLYLAASSAGIDCSHYFQEAAELSSPQQGLFLSVGSMRTFLANFEQSVYFKSDVRPKIGKYLSSRVRNEILNVLADIWDPLGVRNGRYPRNEYDSYVDDIYELLVKDATDAQITDHLRQTALRRMETEPPTSTPHAVRGLRAINLSKD
jgi:hypothetical protein